MLCHFCDRNSRVFTFDFLNLRILTKYFRIYKFLNSTLIHEDFALFMADMIPNNYDTMFSDYFKYINDVA